MNEMSVDLAKGGAEQEGGDDDGDRTGGNRDDSYGEA